MTKLTHVNSKGEAWMVDVSQKGDTEREAVAKGRVMMKPTTLEQIRTAGLKKGDILAVARVAGIMAAKKTPDLIPLCHPLLISNIAIEFDLDRNNSIEITARVKSTGKTGVEMEALVAVSVSALTIYDMCKSVDRAMTIAEIYLESKKGGKSGTYQKKESEDMARIVAVCRSDKKGVSKKPIEEGFFQENYGLVGDAHATSDTHRQVSLLALASIEKMRRLGLQLSAGDFAENLTVEGLDLASLPIGTQLALGKGVILEVTQIGKECHTGCAIFQQIGKCIMPKEGIFARVIKGGLAKAGDEIKVVDNDA